jgi:DNA-binding NarL/FixJ family response regulator
MPIKLIVADDQEVIRRGMAKLLEKEDIKIVAEATTGTEALAKTKKLKPDVLLMDVRMPNVDGLDTLEKVRKAAPDTKVVMMTGYDNPTYAARAVASGAAAFLVKDAPAKEFVATIKRVARGGALAEGSPHGNMRAELDKRSGAEDEDVPLTKREYQVLRHLAYGLSNREIGHSLEISIETVKEHVQNVLRKLDLPDRTAAAVWAMKRNLV